MQKEQYLRKPPWLRIKMTTSPEYMDVKRLMRNQKLNTVCEHAGCPNMHECWGQHKTATVMILGEICTRNCHFCSVEHGKPNSPDPEEPNRVAESVSILGLKHVVITMVTRDDLKDSGAGVITNTVIAVRKQNPTCSIELLTSDLGGIPNNIKGVIASQPEILSHNLETVRRLSPIIRPEADYERSLDFFRIASETNHVLLKSSLMIGLGEKIEEIIHSMDDLRKAGVSILNIGQYLQPTRKHLPVKKYWHPDEFKKMKKIALKMGFKFCEAGPLVRSSYHAAEQYNEIHSN